MTREKKEQLSNRLVLNFSILLGAGLVLLYVNSGLRSGGNVAKNVYGAILGVGIISIIVGIFLLVWGKLRKPAVVNYSFICLGTLIGSAVLYLSKYSLIPGYNNIKAVILVYLAMVVYFVVLAIITSIQMAKPIIKSDAEKIVHGKKKKKRK